MNTVYRGKYCFTGPRAEDSAHYFDLVISYGHCNDDNINFVAWDAAHKFGTRMTADGMASFRNGIVFGARALEAAEYLDTERAKAYASCEEYGRSKKMRELMSIAYSNAQTLYDVKIELH